MDEFLENYGNVLGRIEQYQNEKESIRAQIESIAATEYAEKV